MVSFFARSSSSSTGVAPASTPLLNFLADCAVQSPPCGVVYRCTVAMVRPLELGDRLAVIRLTRGSAHAISHDASGSGKAHEDHISRSGWGWSKSIFKKQSAKVQKQASLQAADQSASEPGL